MDIDLKNLNVGMDLKLVPISAPTQIGVVNVYAVRKSAGKQSTTTPHLYGNNSLQQSISDKLIDPELDLLIVFQDGAPQVNGVNGATIEAYVGASALRLQQYQANDATRCDENQIALNHLLQALQALHDRQTRIAEKLAPRQTDHEHRDD